MSYKSLKGYSNIEYDFPCGLQDAPTSVCVFYKVITKIKQQLLYLCTSGSPGELIAAAGR